MVARRVCLHADDDGSKPTDRRVMRRGPVAKTHAPDKHRGRTWAAAHRPYCATQLSTIVCQIKSAITWAPATVGWIPSGRMYCAVMPWNVGRVSMK